MERNYRFSSFFRTVLASATFLLILAFASLSGSAQTAMADPGNMSSYRGNNGTTYYILITAATGGGLWGCGTYTDDSQIKYAAMHVFGLTAGNQYVMQVVVSPGLSSYSSCTQYGISSSSYGSWGGSYYFSTFYYPSYPTANTSDPTGITSSEASVSGSVTDYGNGSSITSRGVCYSTSSGPTISNSTASGGSGTGSFTATLSGLATGTLYYVRAYGTNNLGQTGYGTQKSFTTTSQTVTFNGGSGYTASLIPGFTNQPLGRFDLTASGSGSSLTAATIKLNGTRSGCSNFKLWESTSATFSTGTATQKGSTVASDPGNGSSVAFSGFSGSLSASIKYFFITCDISASSSGTIQGVVVTNSSLTISGASLSGSISNAVLSALATPLRVNHILGLGKLQSYSYTGSTQTWTVPAGTTNIQLICIGGGGSGGAAYWAGGGGGGGALAYETALSVTPGNTCTIYAGRGGVGITANAGGQGSNGSSSYLTYGGTTVGAAGGSAGVGTYSNTNTPYAGGGGGSPYSTFDGGAAGGTGGSSSGDTGGGGGGTAGYTGSGGNGGWTTGNGGGGAGGANGGNNGANGAAQSGGGTGLNGPGTSGAAAGSGGSGGTNGSANATAGGSSFTGGLYGGGGGGQSNDSKNTPGCDGGSGAVAIFHGYTATYGDPPMTLNAKATSGLAITYSTSDPLVATVSGNVLTINGAGTCTIYANQAGDGSYPAAAQVSQSLTVASSFAGITTTAVTAVASTTATSGGTVTNDGGFPVTARGVCWSNTTNPTISNSKTSNGTGTGTFTSYITGLTAGTTCYIRAYATNSYGTSYGQQYSFTPFQLGSFPDISKTYGDPAFTLVNPTSASPGSFSYSSSDPAVAMISGNTVTITGAGTATITSTQAASGVYGTATTTCTLTVAKANQVLSLSIPTSAPLNTFIGTSVAVTATSSAALSVTVTKGGTATATLNGTIGNYSLTNVGSTGTVIIIADQAGNVNYNAASVSQSFNVEMGNQVITFNTLPGKTFGDPSFTLSATGGGSGNPVTYTSSNGLIATCSGAQGESVTISGAGTIAITADQPGNSNWNPAASVIQYLIVAKATPLISNFSAVGKTWGDAPFTLNASSPGSGAFSFSSSNTSVATISGNTVTITGAGTSTLTAIQDPDDNYVSASTTALLTVAKAGQTITITGLPADISLLSFEGSPIQAEATSTSGLTVSLTLGVGSVATLDGSNLLTSSGATGTVVVEAAQAGNLNFNSATASLNFTVSKLPQTITFEAHPVKNVGDPPFDLAGSSTSSLDISFASGNTDVATVSGKSVAVVGAGTSVITASQAGNAYYDAATPVTQTLTVEACTGTVNPTDGGAIAADQNSCTAFDPALITSTSLATGHKGTLEYKWQSTVAPFSTWSDISSSNTDAYDPPAISETTKFRRVARVTCSSDWVLAAASNTVVMTVNGTIPSTPGAITGIAAQCPGLSGETYSIAPVEYASTYTWTVPTGWFVTDGDGTTSITVNTGSEGQDGSITVTAGNCGSNSSASSLAVTVSSPVPFTPPTVTDLVASGSPGAIIKWYHDATGGSALASSTTLEDGHHYYASQTLNGCESTSRFEVTASVDATPCKPTGIAAQSFSSGATVSSLLATGSKIRWYASSSGGAALATTTLLVNGAHYWASQTINCTESFTRFEVIATIN